MPRRCVVATGGDRAVLSAEDAADPGDLHQPGHLVAADVVAGAASRMPQLPGPVDARVVLPQRPQLVGHVCLVEFGVGQRRLAAGVVGGRRGRCQISLSSGYLFERRHCCEYDRERGACRAARARQKELADRLKASGALDGIFEQIDAGRGPLGGDDGLLKGMLKAALERGLEVELTDHVGYERGDAEASLFPNSRNGTSPKTVSSEVGEVELATPVTVTAASPPQPVPKGSRRLGGLDEMIISLYAGGMTLRDIQHHLVSTIGTELSHETLSKITDQVAEEVFAWQRRPLEPLYPVIYLDALVVKVKDGAHVRNKAAHIAVGVDVDGIKHVHRHAAGRGDFPAVGQRLPAPARPGMATRPGRRVGPVCR
jgi:hypothetical protein